jgi:hypothetical protein
VFGDTHPFGLLFKPESGVGKFLPPNCAPLQPEPYCLLGCSYPEWSCIVSEVQRTEVWGSRVTAGTAVACVEV